MSGDSWELLGAEDRAPDFVPIEREEDASVGTSFAWIVREDRQVAAQFEDAHSEHGGVLLARHQAGYYLVACDCGDHVIVDISLSAPPAHTFPSWPPAAEEGPRFSLDDVVATLRAVDARLRRVETELRGAST